MSEQDSSLHWEDTVKVHEKKKANPLAVLMLLLYCPNTYVEPRPFLRVNCMDSSFTMSAWKHWWLQGITRTFGVISTLISCYILFILATKSYPTHYGVMPTSNWSLCYALYVAIISNSLAWPALCLKIWQRTPHYGVIFSNTTPPCVMCYVASIQMATVCPKPQPPSSIWTSILHQTHNTTQSMLVTRGTLSLLPKALHVPASVVLCPHHMRQKMRWD